MIPAPSFYNQADRDIFKDFQFIPQERFRFGFTPPTFTGTENTADAGIPTVMPRETGGGSSVYNPDMSTIRQDYNPFPARQASEIYSRTFNPQSTFDPNLTRAQNTANLIRTYESGTGPGVMRLGNNVLDVSKFSPEQRASMLKSADDFIDDARMQYATEGQFVDPYDPRYSSETEAQKFMDNYPEYYGVNKKGIELPGILGTAQNFVKGIMPINTRAIMENEARGAGIFTDDIGRIVGDPSTAAGIMAGYNLNKIDAGTFDKRRARIEKTIADKKAKGLDTTALEEKLGLLDEAEEDILGARKTTSLIKKRRKDIKAAKKAEEEAAAKEAEEKRQREEAQRIRDELAAAAAAKDKAAALAAIKKQGQADYNPNIHGPTNYGRDSQGNQSFDFGGGFGIGSDGGPVSNRTGRGRTGFMDGGRIYYMDGGLADLVDIYD